MPGESRPQPSSASSSSSAASPSSAGRRAGAGGPAPPSPPRPRRPGLDVPPPTDLTVDGYRGKQLTLTAPDTFDGCTLSREGYVIWQLPLGATFTMTPGERDQGWILDVDGERPVVAVPGLPTSTAQQRAEVQAILDSLQIEPVGPTSSPSPTP